MILCVIAIIITKPTMLICLKTLIGQIGLLRAVVRIFSPVCKSKITSVGTTIICLLDTLHWWQLKPLSKQLLNIMGYFKIIFSANVFFYVESLFLQLIDLVTSRSWLRSIDHAPKHMSRKQYCENPYFTFSNFLFWQWLLWKQAIFSKCSMMPA